MSARSVSSGVISFGFVSVPFKLYTATSPKSVSFNTLHKACGERLKTQLICPVDDIVVEDTDVVRGLALDGSPGFRRVHRTCSSPVTTQLICPVDNVVVDRADTVRGFEHQRDRYVTFTDEELSALEASRTGVLELQEFVPADSVDALYIERSYFIAPDKGGDRAYQLLADTLRRRGLVGVGRFARRGRDELVVLRAYQRGILMQECFYADEVRSFDDVDTGATFEFKELEQKLADQLVERLMREAFEPGRYRDEWAEKVLDAVNRKVAGEPLRAVSEVPKAQIIDLLERLKRSVATAANTTGLTPAPHRKHGPTIVHHDAAE